MPDINAAAFGLIVAIIVGAMVLAPRMRDRKHKPTVHEMYFNEPVRAARPTHLEREVAAPPTIRPVQPQAGAPRAPSPTRVAPPQAPSAAQPAPQPLKLPY